MFEFVLFFKFLKKMLVVLKDFLKVFICYFDYSGGQRVALKGVEPGLFLQYKLYLPKTLPCSPFYFSQFLLDNFNLFAFIWTFLQSHILVHQRNMFLIINLG